MQIAVIKTHYHHMQMRIVILEYADTAINCIHFLYIYILKQSRFEFGKFKTFRLCSGFFFFFFFFTIILKSYF
jgi:hypothetical protein